MLKSSFYLPRGSEVQRARGSPTEVHGLGNLQTADTDLAHGCRGLLGQGCRAGLCLMRVGLRKHGDMEGNWQSKGVCEGDRRELHRAA